MCTLQEQYGWSSELNMHNEITFLFYILIKYKNRIFIKDGKTIII